MARSRNIKPAFFRNEHLGELPPLTRLLFIALWCEADREGRLEDRPLRLKAEYFPYDDCDVSTMLAQCEHSAGNFLVRYEVGGQKYIQITNFKKHQNPHMKEAASVIPPPPKYSDNKESGASTIPASCKHRACLILAGLIPDSLLLIPDSLISDSREEKPERMTAREFEKLYMNTFNKMMPGGLNYECSETCKLYPPDKIRDAFRIGAENNAKAWSYVKKVLEGEMKPKQEPGQFSEEALRQAEETKAYLRSTGLDI